MRKTTKLLIIAVLATLYFSQAYCAEETLCPLYAQFPLELIEKNLHFNQQEILKKLFTFAHEKQNENSILKRYGQKYRGSFEKQNRFTVKGLPNRTLEITATSIPITTHFQTRPRGNQDSEVTKELLVIEKIIIQVHLYQNEEGELRVQLLDVHTTLGQKASLSETYQKIVQNEIKHRLMDMYNWNTHKWLETLPYGSFLLGGILNNVFKRTGYPALSEDHFIFCISFLGAKQTFYQPSEIKQRAIADVDQSYGRLQFNQEEFNKDLRRLHKSDKIWMLPLEESHQITAIAALRENDFKPFANAHHFTTELFFSEEIFENFWDEDDYVKSNMKIEQGGNMTFQQNLGLYLTNYDESGNQLNKLTILIKMNVKIQLQDTQRTTVSHDKQRFTVKIHHIHIPAFQIYDVNDNLLNMESMKALVGINLEVAKFVQGFDQQFENALKSGAVFNYIGDIYMETPKEHMGFHWIRIFTEVVTGKQFAFVFDFDVEEELIDPVRFESSFKYDFLERRIPKVKAVTLNESLVEEDRWGNMAFYTLFSDLLKQWCVEEIETMGNVDDQALYRCERQWSHEVEFYFSTIYSQSGYHMMEYNGELYRARWVFIVGFQVIVLMLTWVWYRCSSDEKSSQEKKVEEKSSKQESKQNPKNKAKK